MRILKNNYFSQTKEPRDDIKTVLNNGDIVVIYPEARYSLCGTKSIIPNSNAALAKAFKVPLVTLTTHGDHIVEPFYNTKRKKIKGDQQNGLVR